VKPGLGLHVTPGSRLTVTRVRAQDHSFSETRVEAQCVIRAQSLELGLCM
jgi:hypothetical protein